MSKRTQAYVAAIIALGILSTRLAYVLDPTVTPALVRAALCFGMLCALCELLAYQKPGRRETGSIAFLPLLAAVVIAPSWVSVIALAFANAVVQVVQRRVLLKAIFNVAQTVLAVSIAIFV